ncbi:DUF1365 domain-containing protein [Pseudooceanicola aestuarii]|uniref:DUF1365 domain-containing protein n=1 Tax=Pseudooceanicola aestuarii TaxID=2697319 RepID=UPI0013D20EBD|nr:DUF1365 domain-containing protein [Pseudooceanicola aestuarii]
MTAPPDDHGARAPLHLPGHTTHTRRGAIGNAFRYGVDYVLIDPEARRGPWLFSRNRWNLASVHDRSHGGPPGAGRGAAWVREVLARNGADVGPGAKELRLQLLTQPRFIGAVFNPVSFWLAWRGSDLHAVIAEVNNTFGDRHCYFCALPDFAPITATDRLTARKALHVSPFQQIAGDYTFQFDIRPEKLRIVIDFRDGDAGLHATLSGPLRPLTSRGLLAALIRRPAWALRVVALIHWQALKLKLKGAPYRTRPAPPTEEIT